MDGVEELGGGFKELKASRLARYGCLEYLGGITFWITVGGKVLWLCFSGVSRIL